MSQKAKIPFGRADTIWFPMTMIFMFKVKNQRLSKKEDKKWTYHGLHRNRFDSKNRFPFERDVTNWFPMTMISIFEAKIQRASKQEDKKWTYDSFTRSSFESKS